MDDLSSLPQADQDAIGTTLTSPERVPGTQR